MEKNIEQRPSIKEKDALLVLDGDTKPALGPQDSDLNKLSPSDEKSKKGAMASDGYSSGAESDNSGHEINREYSPEDELEPMSVAEALDDPLNEIWSGCCPIGSSCFFCPGRFIEDSAKIPAHLESQVCFPLLVLNAMTNQFGACQGHTRRAKRFAMDAAGVDPESDARPFIRAILKDERASGVIDNEPPSDDEPSDDEPELSVAQALDDPIYSFYYGCSGESRGCVFCPDQEFDDYEMILKHLNSQVHFLSASPDECAEQPLSHLSGSQETDQALHSACS
jgi:hypothetical protein